MTTCFALVAATLAATFAVLIALGMQQRERSAQQERSVRYVCENVEGGCAGRAQDGSCSSCADLFESSTWKPLNGTARAKLYVAAAAAGMLGDGLRDCGAMIEIGVFDGGLRGAVASRDLQASDSCMVSEDALISITTAQSMFGAEFVERVPDADNENEEDVWLALLMLREKRRRRSVLAPYIHSSFSLPSSVPAGWNPATKKGKSKRANLKTQTGPQALEFADAMREKVEDLYSSLVEPALEQLPNILAQGLEDEIGTVGADDGAAEKLAKLYSLQSYIEAFSALRTRVFGDAKQSRIAGLQGSTFLVPLLDLLNHGGTRSNAQVAFQPHKRGFVLQLTRAVARGEQLTWNYVAHCQELALNVYGFFDDEMEPCNSTDESKTSTPA